MLGSATRPLIFLGILASKPKAWQVRDRIAEEQQESPCRRRWTASESGKLSGSWLKAKSASANSTKGFSFGPRRARCNSPFAFDELALCYPRRPAVVQGSAVKRQGHRNWRAATPKPPPWHTDDSNPKRAPTNVQCSHVLTATRSPLPLIGNFDVVSRRRRTVVRHPPTIGVPGSGCF